MGNIFEIRFKRTKNLGNYENEVLEAAMQLEDNEDATLAMLTLKSFVNDSLNEVKAKHIKEVVAEGNVLTLGNKIKDPSSGKEVKKKVAKKVKKKVVVEEEKVITQEILTDKLKEVWKKSGKLIAIDILKSFEVKKVSELKDEDYRVVYKECEKCLK